MERHNRGLWSGNFQYIGAPTVAPSSHASDCPSTKTRSLKAGLSRLTEGQSRYSKEGEGKTMTNRANATAAVDAPISSLFQLMPDLRRATDQRRWATE